MTPVQPRPKPIQEKRETVKWSPPPLSKRALLARLRSIEERMGDITVAPRSRPDQEKLIDDLHALIEESQSVKFKEAKRRAPSLRTLVLLTLSKSGPMTGEQVIEKLGRAKSVRATLSLLAKRGVIECREEIGQLNRYSVNGRHTPVDI